MIINFIIPLIFQAIFEATALTYNSVIFLKKNIEWKKILLIGGISGMTTHFFRLIPISFGFHSVLAFVILTILLTRFYKDRLIECFIAVIKSAILLVVLETICVNLIIFFSKIKLDVFLDSPVLKTLLGLPQILLMFVIGGLILKLRKSKKEEEQQIEL